MAAHLFNESGQMQEVDIPDIFDVLEGGEDESAVKFLLGFNADEDAVATSESANEILNNNGLVQQVLTSSPLTSPTLASPLGQDNNSSPARVVVQIEPPLQSSLSQINNSASSIQGDNEDSKSEKSRKREPVDPSRCIYACDSCGKAFTTKFNLKRHINMHCSRSREAGVPIQGPPSASQPSRKHKKDQNEPVTQQVVSPQPQLKVRRVSTVVTTTVSPVASAASVMTSQTLKTLNPTVVTKAYQDPVTVQLAVNAQGSTKLVTAQKPSLPVQPLPESAVQILQRLGNGLTMTGSGNTKRIVRVINAPQIIATQSRAGITTGATVQLQAIPVTTSTITFPQQPVPLVQIPTGNHRQIVLTSSNLQKKTVDILPPSSSIVSTSDMLPTKTLITPVNVHNPTLNTADLIYRTIVSSSKTAGNQNSPNFTPLQSVVTSSTISSPTCGLNDGPPADLFDSEDGDALSVATTTETPTPPPSLNGDPILSIGAVKSPPQVDFNTGEKVVVLPQPVLEHQDGNNDDLDHTNEENHSQISTLPSNRFHGQLTSIPKGWLRKVVTTSKGFQKVFYYNPVGKRFSCQEEIDQYFARLGYSVPMSLFNFELPKLVDEDEDEDPDDLEDELDEAANINKTLVVKVTSNAKGQATVTPTTSTVVALPPSSTIVTQADTTVVSSIHKTVTASAQQPLVTSTKNNLNTTSHPKVVTIGLTAASSNMPTSTWIEPNT